MAAPLGFKTFTTGEVLTAADTNGYLMQGIWTFADAAARNAAVTVPVEGNTCYLKDTDVIQVYSGSAWVTKSGSPSPLTTKGDVYTFSTADARLAVGANDTVLTADSSTATGLKWATPAAGGMTLISTTTLSGTSVSLTSIPQTYNSLFLIVNGVTWGTGTNGFSLTLNSDAGNNYYITGTDSGSNVRNVNGVGSFRYNRFYDQLNTGGNNCYSFMLNNYTISSYKPVQLYSVYQSSNASTIYSENFAGGYASNTAITSLQMTTNAGYTFSAGTARLYGVK